MRPLALALVVVACSTAAPLAAQETYRERYPVSFALSLGGGVGRQSPDVAIDVLFTHRAGLLPRGAVLLGLTGGTQADFPGSDPTHPAYTSIGLLGGRELGRGLGASVRALAGAAYYSVGGSGTLGVQGRVELATPAPFRLALVVSARGAVLPRIRGERVTLGAIGLGVRLQL